MGIKMLWIIIQKYVLSSFTQNTKMLQIFTMHDNASMISLKGII